MKAAFHYAVKVKLIRYESKDEVSFINYDKVFENENPIVAREEAFKEYDEWIKDLYAGIGKKGEYTSDKQARVDLQRFIKPKHNDTVRVGGSDIDFGNSFGHGIGVYFIIDKPYHSSLLEEDIYDTPGDEHLLHGIGTSENYNDPMQISDALNTEILYYEHYNYSKGDFESRANFYDFDLGEIEEIQFLDTPFDWTGLDVKTVEDKTETKELGDEETEKGELEDDPGQSIEEIIENGEGNTVEFKPALLYNFFTKTGGISVKKKIATAICAFLNANGGFLFIGLNDDGKPQGLEWDFSLSNGKKPKDFFQNEFDQMIEHFLSFSVKSNITGHFYELEGKDIFMVTVEPSKNRPIFLKGLEGKEFWIRGNAGNRQLTDKEELANYCIDRWG